MSEIKEAENRTSHTSIYHAVLILLFFHQKKNYEFRVFSTWPCIKYIAY